MNTIDSLILSYKECCDLITVWGNILCLMESEQGDPDLREAYHKMKPIIDRVYELRGKVIHGGRFQ